MYIKRYVAELGTFGVLLSYNAHHSCLLPSPLSSFPAAKPPAPPRLPIPPAIPEPLLYLGTEKPPPPPREPTYPPIPLLAPPYL